MSDAVSEVRYDLDLPSRDFDTFDLGAFDIGEILPHRPPMLMVREVVELWADGARCAGWIDDTSPFARNGQVSVQLALELAAQSAAVCAALHEARRGQGGDEKGGPKQSEPRRGYLATLRDVRFDMPTVATGARLLADVRPKRNLGGLALYETEVRFDDGRPVLRGAFSVSSSA